MPCSIHWRLANGHTASEPSHPVLALAVMRRMARKYPGVTFWIVCDGVVMTDKRVEVSHA